MSPLRSPILRLIGWVIPVMLILIGLVFVTASLTGSDEPEAVTAPPNVRDVTAFNAPGWAARQAGADVATSDVKVVMVTSVALGPGSYSVRALIGRIDAPASAVAPATVADGAKRSVTTCVLWDVDVVSGAVVEHGALELRSEAGSHPIGDSGDLRRRCEGVAFGG